MSLKLSFQYTILQLITFYWIITAQFQTANMKPCKVGPKFNECIVKTTNAALPTIVKGDSKYRLPVLEPVEIQEISVSEDNKRSIAMNVTLLKVKLHGLKDAKMTKSNFDVNKKHAQLEFFVPVVKILSDYIISGKFLILPIQGNGPAKILLDDVKIVYSFDYSLVKIKGEEHIKILNPDFKYELSKLEVDLKNLFNGDVALGKNMNLVLNENWTELNQTLGPSIARALSMVFTNILDDIAKYVPYSDVLTQ